MKIKVNNVNEPSWKEMNVKSTLPESLKRLDEIAQNIWWVWNSDAKSLFRKIDTEAWIEANSNPIQLLNILSYEKLVSLGDDVEFVKKLDAVYANFKSYMSVPFNKEKPSVAYFSMEYGLTDVLKIYFGGLGSIGRRLSERSQRLCYRYDSHWFPVSLRIFYPNPVG